jgi:peptide/nickel transport system substrate-binding protein
MKRRQPPVRPLAALSATLVVFVCAGCGSSESSTSNGAATVAQNATAASSADAARGQSITIARSSDATSLNPQELNINEDYNTQEAIYAGLVRPAADGKTIEGDLASTWSYEESDLTYTFKLRSGLKFSDGTPITTADIIYSIKLAAKGPEYAPMFAAIKSISAPNPGEIQVVLSKYSNLLLPALSFAFVVPQNLRGQKPVEFFKHPISSGEFSLASWDPNNQMVLARNPNYWNAQGVYPNRLTFRIITDENARLNALQAGNVQLDEYVPDEQVPALSSRQLLESNPRSTLVVMVTNNGRAPFNHPADREAAALAINRELIRKAIWDSDAPPAQGLVPPGLPESAGTPTGAEAWEYNPVKAKALLNGTHPSITLLASYERGIDSSLVSVLQQELTQVGFHVTSQVRDFASAVTQLLSGEFGIFLTPQSAFLPTAGEPVTTYTTLIAPVSHWNVKEAEGFLARLGEARNLAGRKQATTAFERWAHDGFLANPIGNPYVFFGVSKDLRGLRVTPFGTYRMGTLQMEK